MSDNVNDDVNNRDSAASDARDTAYGASHHELHIIEPGSRFSQQSGSARHDDRDDTDGERSDSAPDGSRQARNFRSLKRRPARRLFMAILLLVLVFGVSYGGAELALSQNQTVQSSLSNTGGSDGNAVVTQSEAQISDVATKVSPSVVSIVSDTSSSSTSDSIDDFLNGGTSGDSTESAGTGIIVSSNGYIMTNHHVIDGATKVSVQTSDGTTYDNVTVVGNDPLNDLAFLKINGVTNLTPAQIGNSSTVRIGQGVVAIGNALGQYQNTVTSGIISGIGRPVTASSEDGSSSETLSDLLQTDAAINSGNSGGPLVNYQGQVIGMNTAVASDAQSIGFAIPINSTKGVLKGVLASGTIERAYLGVAYTSITPAVAKQYNLSVNAGAYVHATTGSSVVSGSPADKAGLKDGDIITKVNSDTVGATAGLSSLLGQYTPGTTVSLTVIRGGKTMTVSAALTQYKS